MSRNQGIMTTLPFFPQPYPHELFYSALARYKVRCGILSDKLMLADVFGKQTTVASPEMPNGILHACNNIQPKIAHSPESVIRNHTLYPLYTAFSEANIKNKIMKQMLGNSANTYTTSVGLATCTLKPFNTFRYCPVCIVEQIEQFGEAFWDRRWFGFYTYCCPIHGAKFISTHTAIHESSRHSFTPMLDILPSSSKRKKKIINAKKQDQLLSIAAAQIISQPLGISTTFQQLTHFYRSLAFANNFNRGSQVKQDEVAAFVKNFWTWRWLNNCGFSKDSYQYTIACLFRKHRKHQLYPVHLISALPFFDGNIELWWNAVVNMRKLKSVENSKSTTTKLHSSRQDIDEAKANWLSLVTKFGPKAARYNSSMSKQLYAALYRSDKNWLLNVNKANAIKRNTFKTRVSWNKRDYATCKKLFSILYKTNDIYSPRRSKRWFLSQLPNMASTEHNLYRLPRTAKFLSAYSESHQDYQCRRLMIITRDYTTENNLAQPWQLYRRARINTQRHLSLQVKTTCNWCFNWLTDHTR